MRVVIDGSDLSGRDTLVDSLCDVLTRSDVVVHTRKQCMSSPRLSSLIVWMRRTLRPSSLITLWVSLFATALDAVLDPRPARGEVVILCGSASESLGLAEVFGHRLTAWLLRRFIPQSFDVRVFLSASHLEKVRRYLRRDDNTPLDRLVLTDPDRSLRLDRALEQWHAQVGSLLLDTDGTPAEALAGPVLAAIQVGLPTPAPVAQPLLYPAA